MADKRNNSFPSSSVRFNSITGFFSAKALCVSIGKFSIDVHFRVTTYLPSSVLFFLIMFSANVGCH